MNSFEELLSAPRGPARAPAPAVPLRLGHAVGLAVLEGSLVGWPRGGLRGALVGGLVGLLAGPALAWWLWVIRRGKYGLGRALLLGLVGQAVVTLMLAAAARWLVGVPLLEVIASVTALIGLGVGVPLLLAMTITLERTWAALGGLVGAPVAVILLLVSWGVNPPRAGAGERTALLAVAATAGAFLAAGAAAVGRALVRAVRRLLVRWRCHRRRPAADDEPAPRLDLDDVAAVLDSEHGDPPAALLVLAALRDGVRVLHFDTLGAVCRVTAERADGDRRVRPMPVYADHWAAVLIASARWDGQAADGHHVGRLPVCVGGHTVELPLWLGVAGDQVRGSLHLPPPDAVPAQPLERLWRDYREFRGDAWGCACVRAELRRDAAGGGEPPGAATVRLVYDGGGPKADLLGAFRVEFDGQLLGTMLDFATRFEHVVTAAPGPHLLQFLPVRALARWRVRTFLLNVVDAGAYEVRLRWDNVRGGFRRQAEVYDESAAAAAPAETLRPAARSMSIARPAPSAKEVPP